LWLDGRVRRPKNEANKKRICPDRASRTDRKWHARKATTGKIGSGRFKEGINDALEDDKMLTKDKPETLIHLLASFRRAKFPKDPARPQNLAGLAMTIAGNCAVTIAFSERRLRKITEDNEEAFALCGLREEAMILKRRSARLGSNARSRDLRKEVESLRLEYDNFTGSLRYVVGLLDPSLGEKLDGIL
jgi:hypothetical protein